MRAAAAVACLDLPAMAGCGVGGGEDPEKEARQVVRDFAQATTESDGAELCGEIFTREFIERTTGATGEDAVKQCERQFRALRGMKVKIAKIEEVKVKGDTATVVAEVETESQTQARTFRLKREDGELRLVSG